ncbi:MAG: hypothetical protein KC621_23920 [Myxococcales bacterium]|nr:hypothetical protein [Myxococcales bacterium]
MAERLREEARHRGIEIGVVLVGPEACRIRLDESDDLPVIRVRTETIEPLEEDLAAMVGYAADGTFHGPDADRWRTLDGPHLKSETSVLWACAQVQAAGLHQATLGWEKVLLVGWCDEPAVVPAARALVEGDRQLTVLLGGSIDEGEGPPRAMVQSVCSVLAHMVRQGQVATVIWNPEPTQVVDVALDAARHPDPIKVPRAKPLDIGPMLEQPSTWCVPASPVHFFGLVHVPMGYARSLPDLAVLVATWRALRDAIGGPPVDVPAPSRPTEERPRILDPRLHVRVEESVRGALDQVKFEGDELLVEQIDRVLRPVMSQVEQQLSHIAEAERDRLRHLRSFSACGVHYTVQSLAARLDAIAEPYPQDRLDAIERLTSGEAGVVIGDRVQVTAWRKAFAGLPSRVARPGTPGWQLARQFVKERFQLMRAELGAGLSRHIEVLVRRAIDPDAEPSTDELRALLDRAERVRGTLADAMEHLEQRIRAEAEEAVRNDRFVRWTAGDATTLFQQLLQRVPTMGFATPIDRQVVETLSRRAFGMADDRDFARYLTEVAREVHVLPDQAERPSYETVLLSLLQGRDPPVLRQAIAQSQGAEVELHLERPVEPALMNWLTATGMLVVVAPRLKTCAIYWQRLERLDSELRQRLRRATTEHRMSDLVLPRAGGDDAEDLANLVKAASCLLVGLVLGVLAVHRRQEGIGVHVLVGRDLGLPDLVLLPHGGLHLFANDPDLLHRVRRRVDERLHSLHLEPSATETVRKLVELATLGPSSTLSAQIGLFGARFEHLEQPLHAVLARHANLAAAGLVDVLHSSELERLLRAPRRRTLVDVMQLAPTGGPS